MALINLNFFSEALRTQQEVSIVIPQKSTDGEIGIENSGKSDKFKCLFLLHGLSDNHTIWLRRTSIERYAQKAGLAVVMPSADRSFYTDMKYGGKYYTYVANELPRVIREFFNVSDKREDNFIAGLSMGGYGTLKIGMKECDRFCACAGLSSTADIQGIKDRFPNDYKNIFGEDGIPASEDLFDIASQCVNNPNRPKIFMGVGTEDYNYESNIKLKKHLQNLGFDLTYKDSRGTHSWDFWDEYIQYVLTWILEQ